MMYAIVETGGKQYRVKPGDTVAVEKLAGEPGETLDLDRVLLVAGNGDAEARVGSPGVAGAIVRAEVVEHIRGEKIIVFRYKSKVRYRRKTGHRQSLTRLRITDILLDGASSLPAEERPAPVTAVASPESERTEAPESTEVTTATRRRRATFVTSAADVTDDTDDMPASAAEGGPPPEDDPNPTATDAEDTSKTQP
jgi:large subunit ribosomal protein L21